MVDFAVSSDAPRRLDGIVLTKFDTIDDKVRMRGCCCGVAVPCHCCLPYPHTAACCIWYGPLLLQVGTALSMVYRTSIPIVFLGTGQKYTDLRKLNVGAVVKALMS